MQIEVRTSLGWTFPLPCTGLDPELAQMEMSHHILCGTQLHWGSALLHSVGSAPPVTGVITITPLDSLL